MQDTIKKEDVTKWLERMNDVLDKMETFDSRGEEMLSNIKAYVSDSKHFLDKGNLVLSFECMVHAFAIFETCKELGVLEVRR